MGSRKENQNSLYNVFPAPYSKKKWKYGYDEQHDIIVISKDGTLGQVYEISGIKIGLPEVPKVVHSNATYRDKQYWKRFDYPPALSRIKSIFQWNDMTPDFKEAHISYIEKEFDRRENGFWFMNYGHPTYITGGHYMYLQWSKIDVGYPDFREANRIFFIFWEACLADPRCFGMCYLKIRRSGFSFMSSSMAVNIATLSRNSRIGILSKTGADAKKMFTDKVVPISSNYPFFFNINQIV